MKTKATKIALLGSLIFTILITNRPLFAQGSTRMEAMYVYNFTKYISWGTSGNSEKFVIGILGEGEALEEFKNSLSGKKVANKTIEVKTINAAQVNECQMVYVPSKFSTELESLIQRVKGKATLLICQDDLAEKGAGISFYKQAGKLKFKVNTVSLKEAGLRTSENLLNYATVINK
jgi:hypothetical protein